MGRAPWNYIRRLGLDGIPLAHSLGPPSLPTRLAYGFGCGCLQSLISHPRSVHLSAGFAPPDSWLHAHDLWVCMACHELSADGLLVPGSEVLLGGASSAGGR